MERKFASIQTILDIQPIPGADAIEVLTILGWKVVAKKGEFHVGEQVVYCEVDSILPERCEFEFLRKNHFRIKTIRLRGQVSQGICLPLSIIPYAYAHDLGLNFIPQSCLKEGDDVTEVLNIKKYEPCVPAQLAGLAKGNFPEFLHKTDETRIQAVPDILQRHKDKKFYVTEKVDGSSMTVYLNNGVFGVCSRNLDMKEEGGTSYWKVARELDLENKLRSVGKNICLQGELVGQGVQGNKYKLNNLNFFIFNVFDIDTGLHFNFKEFTEMVSYLGLTTVPQLGTIILSSFPTVDELVEWSKGKSLLNKDTHREGIVLRPLVNEYDEDLRGRLSFKCINSDFLLKYDSE